MAHLVSRRQLLLSGLSGVCCAAGCGTILYPERRGQQGGTLDTGVILLDGLGLLLFFVPGVIAFAVDFATGAIYLPPGESQKLSDRGNRKEFQTIYHPPASLSRSEIAKVVSKHQGQVVSLDEGKYRSAELKSLDDFWPTMDRLRAEQSATHPA
jgi:hypothetical protein